MKKFLFIGDIHGRTDWRETALEGLKRFQEVVFLGDYFDSFDKSFFQQMENFKALLAFLRKKGGTALLGNHDYAYIFGYSQISGYQFAQAHQIQQILKENIDLFKIAYGYRSEKQIYTLFSHAGLTQTFWNRYVLPTEDFVNKVSDKTIGTLEIHETLNYLQDKKDIMWKVGSMRGGAGTPGPLWADIRELIDDPMGGINQVVGHTANHSISLDFPNDQFIAKVDNFGPRVASLVISL